MNSAGTNSNNIAATNLAETAPTSTNIRPSTNIRQNLLALPVPVSETIQTGLPWALEYLQNRTSSTVQGEREQKAYRFELLKAYFKQSLSATASKRLSEKHLVDDLLKVALALSFYLPARELVLVENRREEGLHEFVVWVQGREDIEAEMDALDLFDKEWLTLQTAKLKQGIIILVE